MFAKSTFYLDNVISTDSSVNKPSDEFILKYISIN